MGTIIFKIEYGTLKATALVELSLSGIVSVVLCRRLRNARKRPGRYRAFCGIRNREDARTPGTSPGVIRFFMKACPGVFLRNLVVLIYFNARYFNLRQYDYLKLFYQIYI